ncbi:hypothetical protein ACN47E_003799 [Coniothyrium glycines]
MVYSLAAGRTLLRTPCASLPRQFLRYKSITAAIERGRQGGPDRPSRTRTSATEARDGGVTRLKTRRELRFERFGPARDDQSSTPPADRPARRSSRFGRVGPPSFTDRPSKYEGNQLSASHGDRSRMRGDRSSRDDEDRPSRLDAERSSRSNGRVSSRFDRGSPSRFNEERSSRYDRGSPGRFDGERSSTFNEKRPSRFAGEGSSRDNGQSFGSYDAESHRSRFREQEKPRRLDDASTRHNRSNDFGGLLEVRGQDRKRTSQPGEYDRHADTGEVARNWERPGRRQSENTKPYAARVTNPHDDRPQSSYSDGRSAYPGPRRPFGSRGPETLPYTTAASEFIYGHSSVLAAIKADRRKLYKLYVHSRGANRDGVLALIRQRKLFSATEEVGDEYLPALDRASSGRPHNGVVLEASPLPVPPITELKVASLEESTFQVSLDNQSTEDAVVNGKQEMYSYKSAGWRYPLILYVDGVLDEGNLGAIARSAYFLGVDAIVTPTRQTATWSHIALKASAGAAEAVPIFKVAEPTEFLGKSAQSGWKIYRSDAVSPVTSASWNGGEVTREADGKVIFTDIKQGRKTLAADYSPVAMHPTILMMGAEGTGLRTSLRKLAHFEVGIPHGRESNEVGVDSLNVSVAASLLCYEMLQRPKTTAAPTSLENSLF